MLWSLEFEVVGGHSGKIFLLLAASAKADIDTYIFLYPEFLVLRFAGTKLMSAATLKDLVPV